MMAFTILRRKAKSRQQLVDTQEAFNLWSMLRSKYMVIERLQSWENFAHDHDLRLMLQVHLKELKENVAILEKMLKKYSINGPDQQNRYSIKAPSNPEVFQDQFIAEDTFLYLQEHVENLIRALRNSITNDPVRKQFLKFAIKTINQMDSLVQYLKLKGWLETPPLYVDTPSTLTEKLSTCEAYHLWDQLAYRYDNLRQTRIYLSFAYDGDFKVVLAKGIDQLGKNSNILERELEYFGIPFPKKPSAIVTPPNDTEIFSDEHMYRIVLIGIQGTLTLHAQALKQCTFNDRIRGIFKKMLLEEINYIDNYIRFGKMKSWLNPVPAYRT